MSNRYWVGGSGTWNASDTSHWSSSTGGSSGASAPTSADDAFFNANSGGGTVTRSGTVDILSLDMTGFTGGLAGSGVLNIHGPLLRFQTGMSNTYTGSIAPRYTGGTTYLDTKGVDIRSQCVPQVNTVVELQSDWLGVPGVTTTWSGPTSSMTVNTAGYTLQVSSIAPTTSTTHTYNFGSSQIILYGGASSTLMDLQSGTVNPGTSKIILDNVQAAERIFVGQGFTYNDIEIADSNGGGNIQIQGSNTFNAFTTNLSAAKTLRFVAGTTNVFASFSGGGTSGNLLSIESVTAATHTLSKSGGGIVSCDYLSLSYSVASPGSTWFAGANSTNVGNNTGWTFTAPPAGDALFFGANF